MSEHGFELDEMGPIDYVVLEWPDRQPQGGEIVPMIVDLADRGIIRIIDIGFVTKDADGSVASIDLENMGDDTFAVFEGASTGVLGEDDIHEAGSILEPGTSAAVIVWENRWAAPLAVALRRSGAQLASSGRLPVQALLASLEAMEVAG
jgi:hypothetical protein